MNKEDFIEQLRQSLYGEVDSEIITENVIYYRGYIEEQMHAGRSEQQVLEELGNPAFIAKSIIDANENKNTSYTTSQEQQTYYNDPYPEMEWEERKRELKHGATNLLYWIGGIVLVIIILLLVAAVASVFLPIVFIIVAIVVVKRLFDEFF